MVAELIVSTFVVFALCGATTSADNLSDLIPLYCSDGGTSSISGGPPSLHTTDSAKVVTFVAAPPPSAPFTLVTRIRTSGAVTGKYQVFVGWGSGRGGFPGLDFCVTPNGNLRYAEDHPDGKTYHAVLTSGLNLADNAWHTVSVVRLASGKVSLVADGKLVKEEEKFDATTPVGLVAGAISAAPVGNLIESHQVFSGDVGPLRIYNTGLSIGQINSVKTEPCSKARFIGVGDCLRNKTGGASVKHYDRYIVNEKHKPVSLAMCIDLLLSVQGVPGIRGVEHCQSRCRICVDDGFSNPCPDTTGVCTLQTDVMNSSDVFNDRYNSTGPIMAADGAETCVCYALDVGASASKDTSQEQGRTQLASGSTSKGLHASRNINVVCWSWFFFLLLLQAPVVM